MRVRRPDKPRRRAAYGIVQQQCRAYRTTDSVSMPALATLSLLPHALSGAIHIAGLVADALDAVKASSAGSSQSQQGKKKSAKSGSDQTVDASQLVNAFAAYLAAAQPAAVPIAVTPTTSTNAPVAKQGAATGKASIKDATASLAPLAMMLAAGPTTAITTAMALRSAPVKTNTPASGGANPLVGTPVVAAAKGQVAAGAAQLPTAKPAAAVVRSQVEQEKKSPVVVRSQALPGSESVAVVPSQVKHGTESVAVVPTQAKPGSNHSEKTEQPRSTPPSLVKLQNSVHPPDTSSKTANPVTIPHGTAKANALHPAAMPSAAPVAKAPFPTKVDQTKSIAGGRQTSDQAKPSTAGSPPSDRSLAGLKPPVPETLLASYEQGTTEIPVLALHDVPMPTAQAAPQLPAVARALRPERIEPPEVAASPPEEAPSRTPWGRGSFAWQRDEPLPAPAISPLIAGMQPKFVGWAERSENHQTAPASSEGSAHSANRNDSQPQSGSSGAASSLSAVPPPIAVGPVSVPTGNTNTAGPTAAQPNGSPADQLSHALVTQASLINYEGRTDFHLRLQPPQLGNVQIHLTATDHTVSARILVNQEGTRQLIEGQVQQLRQSLANSGLVLGSFDVTHDGGGFSHSGHHPPPELPSPPLPRSIAATPRAVVKTSLAVPTGGINILA